MIAGARGVGALRDEHSSWMPSRTFRGERATLAISIVDSHDVKDTDDSNRYIKFGDLP